METPRRCAPESSRSGGFLPQRLFDRLILHIHTPPKAIYIINGLQKATEDHVYRLMHAF